jgi:hypothetical protein
MRGLPLIVEINYKKTFFLPPMRLQDVIQGERHPTAAGCHPQRRKSQQVLFLLEEQSTQWTLFRANIVSTTIYFNQNIHNVSLSLISSVDTYPWALLL